MRSLAVLIAALIMIPERGQACGVDTDCELGGRTYRISMPQERSTGPVGALVYAHGYRGSAGAAMKNKALRELAHEHGMALVAIKSAGDDWLIPGVPENPQETGDKEFDYVDAVIADLSSRHGIDTDRLIATGFSAGGMMVWNLACRMGNRFAGFLPVAGTFWEPVPGRCETGPVHLVHIHGTSDKIVPLTGRPIQQTRQGSVIEALELARREWTFPQFEKTDVSGEFFRKADDLDCSIQKNVSGQRLGFCQHPGGHSLKMSHLRTGLALLREAGAF